MSPATQFPSSADIIVQVRLSQAPQVGRPLILYDCLCSLLDDSLGYCEFGENIGVVELLRGRLVEAFAGDQSDLGRASSGSSRIAGSRAL